MDLLVIHTSCTFDEARRRYVSCYYVTERPTDHRVSRMVVWRKLDEACAQEQKPRACRYYFVSTETGELYTSNEFARLVAELTKLAYIPVPNMLKAIRTQDNSVCLVIRRKLRE